MTIYPDTSVLIAAFTHDTQTQRALTWLAGKPRLALSNWTAAEFSSALRIQQRRGSLSPDLVAEVEQTYDRLAKRPGATHPILPEDIMEARRLVQSEHGLRAPDALHMAIAARLGFALATFDLVQRDAARAVGLEVIDL